MANGTHLTSILLPSAHRPRELRRCLESIFVTVGHNPVEVLLSLVEGDVISQAALNGVVMNAGNVLIEYERTPEEYERGAVFAWNQLAAQARGDVIALFADDLVCRNDWLTRALIHLEMIGGDGLIGFNDLGTDGHLFAAHWIASRRFLIEHNGGVIYPPMYHCWWCDREISDRAKQAEKHIFALDVIVEHLHYTWSKSPVDATYREGIAYHEIDRRLYENRKADGFPNDYEPILTPLTEAA